MKPKILGLHHDHIDGSAAVGTIIRDLYQNAGRFFPFPSVEEWLAFMRDDSKDIVLRFGTVTGVLQTEETLELLAYTYVRHRAAEGYKYLEGKFAPQYHTLRGLTMRQVADAVYRGMKRAQRNFGVVAVPVICIGREAEPEVGVEIAKIACAYDGEMVLDLVCDEAGHPPEKHFPAYELTFGTNVKRDCHAGEWVSPGPDYMKRLARNLRTAITTLRCHGIGHAIPLARDPELVQLVIDRGVRVAGCPLSNLRSGLVANLWELGIGYLLDRGVIYTLNPDDDLFLPTMETVIKECDASYSFTASHCRALEENVWKGAFGRVPR